MDATQDDAIRLLISDPAVFALLIAAFLLLFWLKSKSGKILFFGLLLLDLDHYYFTFIYESDVLMHDYGLGSLMGVMEYTRYIGIVLCWYALVKQVSHIKTRQNASHSSAETSEPKLPPAFRRNHNPMARVRTERAQTESKANGLVERIRSEQAERSASSDKNRGFGRDL